MTEPEMTTDDLAIAVVGMAGRFPGAPDLRAFWQNVRSGTCSVTWLPDDDEHDGEARVRAAYLMAGSDRFDAEFFGYSPREAELLDPQHRVFLECAWAAVEDGALDPARFDGVVGVWGGSGHNTYLTDHLLRRDDLVSAAGGKQLLVGNRADYLTSRVAYKLGLTGPAVTVQTACSTSLVAVAEACKSLLAFECDAALAGGVAVAPDRHDGYDYQEDGILSPDGLTRTLDRRAGGTVGGDGVGVVLLRRLEDAVADGDDVRAVIRGFAVNNDGAQRVGFSAPSAESQARVLRQAMDSADVDPASLQYVELHGTATALGDSIEVAALRAVFDGLPAGSLHVGSVKPNVGHLDAAAGVAGLIKTVLAIQHGEIPPLVHFEAPGERLGLESSPMTVPTSAVAWPSSAGPRRAGVSSFGLGGTNVHVVIEEPPAPAPRPPAPARGELLVWTGRSEGDVDRLTGRLRDWLARTPDLDLRDVALTLGEGRRHFDHRRAVVATDARDALDAITSDDGRLLTGRARVDRDRPVGFLVGGFGAERPGMARDLYESEEVFRAAVDACIEALTDRGDSLRAALLDEGEDDPHHPVHRPSTGYPAVFAYELGLVRLWESWGLGPAAMVGHSLGEYVVAHVAGVFDLQDALRLVVGRAELLERHAEGAMLAVALPESRVGELLGPDVSVAAVNDSFSCVLAGTSSAIDAVVDAVDAAGSVSQRLASPYAFHSPLVEGALEEYRALVGATRRSAPSVPFVSNLTGTWITDDQAVDPEYWVRHMREPVRYADAVGALWAVPDLLLLEVAEGQTLTAGAMQHPARADTEDGIAVPSLPGAATHGTEHPRASLLRAAGRLWAAGAPLAAVPTPGARRVGAPTYPFDGSRYWVERGALESTRSRPDARIAERDQWIHTPAWRQVALEQVDLRPGEEVLVLAADAPWCLDLAARLRGTGARVTTVQQGEWAEDGDGFFLDIGQARELARLVQALGTSGRVPDRVVLAAPEDPFGLAVRWAQAGREWLESRPQRWHVVTTGALPLAGRAELSPEAAAAGGLTRVLGQEYPEVGCVHLDLPPGPGAEVVDLLLEGLGAGPELGELAMGDGRWWTRDHQHLDRASRGVDRRRPGGRYVVTGGLGRIGRIASAVLCETGPVHLLLLNRSAHPAEQAELEALQVDGTTVDVRQVDVGDAEAVSAAIDEFSARWGGVDGVLHAAGTTGAAAHAAVVDVGPDDLASQHRAKLRGAENLRAALADQELDFAIICSSIASVLGGLEFATYAAANASLDTFAAQWWRPRQPWCSVGWEAWAFPGVHDAPGTELGAAVRELALTPEEGAQVLRELLRGGLGDRVVISTGDLRARIATWREPAAATVTTVHARPSLHTAYVAPSTSEEVAVAAVWNQILGVEAVGVNDSFFELGGTSLLGLQVVHRLRRDLTVSLPLTSIYEAPTVRALASLVAEQREEGRA